MVVMQLFSAVSYAALPANFQSSLVIGSGLSFPTAFEIAPDGRIFILERGGNVRIYKNGQLLDQPFVYLPSVTSGDRGLLGIALDPNFSSNHLIYFYYTAAPDAGGNSYNYLVRFNAEQDVATGGPVELYRTYVHSDELHVGGAVRFGNDGKIYLAVGDNGNPLNAQDLGTPFGKILRLNPDGSVPADNPFVNTPGALGEIWAYGLRNPWRFQVDSVTGQLIGGEVGQAEWEEVNHYQAGKNYGWPSAEGTCNPNLVDCLNLKDPMYVYAHNGQSRAATGGPIYRGSMFPPEYVDDYFIGDYAAGTIVRLDLDWTTPDDPGVVGVYDFETEAGAVVDHKVAFDGSYYYLTLWPGQLHRISYSTDNQVPVAYANADQLTGSAPLSVQFSSDSSFDPDGDGLSFAWNFGDGTSSTEANPSKTYGADGNYTVTLTVSDGTDQSQAQPLHVKVGDPPVVNISQPVDGSVYRIGDMVSYAASAVDAQGNVIPVSGITVEILMHRLGNIHPMYGPAVGEASGAIELKNLGKPEPGIYYEFIFTAKDSNGLTASDSHFVYPVNANYSFNTNPQGLQVVLNGQPELAPINREGVVNYPFTVSTPLLQAMGDQLYQFVGWNVGNHNVYSVRLPEGGYSDMAQFVPTSAWVGSYYDNTDLAGEPVLTRPDVQINFEWWGASPDLRMPADNWSARWTKTVDFPAGLYRLTTTTDDGVRLYVDGQLVIDQWHDQMASEVHSYMVNINGSHDVKMEYYERTMGAAAKLQIDLLGQMDANYPTIGDLAPTPTPTEVVTPTPTAEVTPAPGQWTAEFWNNVAPYALDNPVVPTENPELVLNTDAVWFDWVEDSPGAGILNDHFGVRFSKTENFESGTYKFSLLGDDGVRLLIDGVEVVDGWNDQAATEYVTEIPVTGGDHLLEVEFYDRAGFATVMLGYELIGVATPTPTVEVTPTPTPTISPDQWTAEFWNNVAPYALDNPVVPTENPELVLSANEVWFDWVEGSPGTGILNDHFGVRFRKNVSLESGIYRFSLLGDDGVRLLIDGVEVIDGWNDQSATEFVAEVPVNVGDHLLEVEFYDRAGFATVMFGYELVSPATPTPTLTAEPTPTAVVTATPTAEPTPTETPTPMISPTPPAVSEWIMEYWNDVAPFGLVDPTIPASDPVVTQTTGDLNFNWGETEPAAGVNYDHFGVRATRSVTLDEGTYQFTARVDDGVRVWADDQLVIDAWQDQGVTEFTGEVWLPAGAHNLKVEYFDRAGEAVLKVGYGLLL